MLQCVTVCYSVLQCVAVCYSVLHVLQCVVVCSGVLQCHRGASAYKWARLMSWLGGEFRVLQCFAVCFSVFQCAVVCCSELNRQDL